MTIRGVATFNVNQFSTPDHQRADLTRRMKDSDVMLLQECVDLDLAEFVKLHPGWGAFQVRHGDNDGHANTGVLYRLDGGPVTDTACTFLTDTTGERRRFLTGVQQGGGWYWSAHINPRRFQRGIPDQLAHIGGWVRVHPGPHVGGLDRNQCPPGALENATGLTWHGVGIDGFLTNRPIANVAEFPKGFSDHPGVHGDATIPTTPPTPQEPPVVKPPAPKYRGPAAHTSSGENKPIHRIVIHSTVSPCKVGGAEDIARYFRSKASGGSAHYVVDPGDVVQVVYDSVVAWHAPGADWSDKSHPEPESVHSIGIEMCDIPGPVPNDKPGTAAYKAAKRAWRWIRPEQRVMLDRVARLTAQLAAAYDVPVVYLGVPRLKEGRKGITTHNNVSQAFNRSTHWDPGFWPRRRFMRLVRKYHNELTTAAPKGH